MKSFLGALLLVAFAITYWKVVAVIVVVVVFIKAAPVVWRDVQTQRATTARRRAELIERADQQHRWASEGDPRGTFGEWTPAC